MTEIYDFAVDRIFCGFICRDAGLLRTIEAFEGALGVREESLQFTLPALYEFVCRSYEMDTGRVVGRDRGGYLHFRKALYQNLTNSRLSALGGQVELETPNSDHDLVVYKLVRKNRSCELE